ncbi:hypothetical protein [Amnibacterium kyonggiense]|uniref:hypothetical protein n=1 Tax=Amnibacterium kyonggiense TaxID=595671 RepID=UPI00105D2EED|nr:hypothetical protein [Amnibacterium kyonggiense]
MQPITARHQLRFVGVRNHTGLDDRTLRKAAARGELTQVARSAFVGSSVWTALSIDERRRLVLAARAARAKQPIVFSHRSAADLHGVPMTGRRDTGVDVLTTLANGSRREHGFTKHASAMPDLEVVDVEGLRVTSVARTVVELAMVLPFRDAVASADWALRRGIPRQELLALLDLLGTGAARKRGARVIAFADPRSGSPDESKSRALIDELGFPPPDLQARFEDEFGFIGDVDFFWSHVPLIGEFDGAIKLRDPAMLRGRTPAEVVRDEKRREDRLRRQGPLVVRWGHEDLSMSRLGTILFGAGLRPVV